jgi:hypothetical protein
MSALDIYQMVKKAKSALGNHVTFIQKTTANAANVRLRDLRLTFDEMRRAGYSAARSVIPNAPDELISILSNNAELMNFIIHDTARGRSVKAIIQSAVSEIIVSRLLEELLSRWEDQYIDVDVQSLTALAQRMSETLMQISVPTPSFYAQTYREALDRFEAEVSEGTMGDLAFVSVSYIDYMKDAGELEIARRITEEMDFVTRRPERFIVPALELAP